MKHRQKTGLDKKKRRKVKVGVKNVDCQVESGWINIQNLIKSKAREKGDVSVLHIRGAPEKKLPIDEKADELTVLKKAKC